jgi:hypothetical protein
MHSGRGVATFRRNLLPPATMLKLEAGGFFVVKGPAADDMDAPQPWGLLCNPVMKMISFFLFFRLMEHRWNEIDRGKPKYLGEKPVPMPLCPPQIPHGLTRYRTRASAVRTRRLTAWAMARPKAVRFSKMFLSIKLHGVTLKKD